ncbi:hypothetical protein EYF80_022533 [Liparis tanakae]|uniref:Uncharacterized protein n=1 Tax=Liparis tanakae TaxID=230148 RepID=A0A4Z2HQM5_9TELE|nr:hypothetical protein EYF80_022533 [Liparis tanakae]
MPCSTHVRPSFHVTPRLSQLTKTLVQSPRDTSPNFSMQAIQKNKNIHSQKAAAEENAESEMGTFRMNNAAVNESAALLSWCQVLQELDESRKVWCCGADSQPGTEDHGFSGVRLTLGGRHRGAGMGLNTVVFAKSLVEVQLLAGDSDVHAAVTEAQIDGWKAGKLLSQVEHLRVFVVVQLHTNRDGFAVPLILRQMQTLTTITVARGRCSSPTVSGLFSKISLASSLSHSSSMHSLSRLPFLLSSNRELALLGLLRNWVAVLWLRTKE